MLDRRARATRGCGTRRSSARSRRSSAFDTEEEAVAAANDTEYGLVAYVFTRDLDRALRVSERLETGMVGLNQGIVSNPAAPFGGVKQSGLGREGGHVGIEEFLETKYVALATPGLSGGDVNTTTPGRRIALIPGDGIGVEVAASARTVLATLDERYDLALRIDEFDWSCERYLAEGALMPADGAGDPAPSTTRSCSARSAGPAYPTTSRCGDC